MARRETKRHQEAFEIWYEASRNFKSVSESFSISDRQARNWAESYHWVARADQRDTRARALEEAAAVNRRAALIRKQRETGALLTARGREYMGTNKITKAGDAVVAIKAGIELERQSEGLPDFVVETLNASADARRERLEEIAERLRSRNRNALDRGEPEG